MEIREKHNLASLFLNSFALLNRCGGALAVWLILTVVLILGQKMLYFIGVPALLVKFIILLPSTYMGAALLRILGAKAENTGESVSNSFSASVFPTVYFLILNIILAAFAAAATFITVKFIQLMPIREKLQGAVLAAMTGTDTASTWLSAATALLTAFLPLLLCALLAVRLIFAQAAIILRDQGPIEALIYSWQLTSGKKYFTALGAGIISVLAVPVYIGVVLYGLYVLIPLHFADSFSLANLSPIWLGVFAALGLGYLLILLVIPAFIVLVFLNQDYGHNRDSFTPQAELKLTNRENQVFGENNNILPPGVGNLVTPEDVHGVQVTKSSVKASPDGVTEQHLQEVYQPRPEDLVQYTEEEDRMPTILFDDEMARQIEQERTMWQVKQEQDKAKKGEDDAPSVKMSK